MQKEGVKATLMHMRHLWPLPYGLREIFEGFDRIVVPEMNRGQLAKVLKMEY